MIDDDPYEQDLSGFDVEDHYDQDHHRPQQHPASLKPSGCDDDDDGSVSSTATVDENLPASSSPSMSPLTNPMSPLSNSSSVTRRMPSRGSVVSPEQRGEAAERKLAELKSSQRLGAIRKAFGRSPASRDSVNQNPISPPPARQPTAAAPIATSPRVAPLPPVSSPKTSAVLSEAAKNAASATSPAYHSYASPSRSSLLSPVASGQGGRRSSGQKSGALRQLEARYEKAKAAPGRKDAALLKSIQVAISAQRAEDEQRSRLEEDLEEAAGAEDWDRYALIGQRLDALGQSAAAAHVAASPPPRPLSALIPGISKTKASGAATTSETSPSPSARPVAARIVARRSPTASARALPPSPPRGPISLGGLAALGGDERPGRPGPPPLAPPPAPHADEARTHEVRQLDRAAAALDFVALSMLFRVALEEKHAASTVAHSCRLVALLAMEGAHQVAIGAAKLCRAVVQAMDAHSADRTVQLSGLEALFRLGHDAHNQESLGRDGACPVLLNAMRTFPADRDVVLAGCKVREAALRGSTEQFTHFNIFVRWYDLQACWILAAGHSGNTGALGGSGGCGIIVNAMRLFCSDQQAQEWCARCIINLTVSRASSLRQGRWTPEHPPPTRPLVIHPRSPRGRPSVATRPR